MIFLTDEHLMAVAGLLKVFDTRHIIYKFTDKFERKTPDPVWITEAGTWDPKPIVLSIDTKILRNKVEVEALRASKLTWFALSDGWGELGWYDVLAWKIIKVWPSIVSSAESTSRPTIYKVGAGNLKITTVSIH